MGDERHPGQQRRGVRQGRLPDARRSTASSATPALPEPEHRFLTTGSPRSSPRSAGGSSAPSWSRAPVRAGHVVGVTRVKADRRSAAPAPSPAPTRRPAATWSRPSTTAAPGGSCSTSATARSGAAALRRPADHRRRALQPPARRPLPRPVRLLRRCASTTPTAPAPAIPVWGPRRHRRPVARAYDLRRGPRDDRGVRLPRVRRRRPIQLGPFTVTAAPGRAPGDGLRPARRGRRARCSPTPATAGSARARRRWPPDADLLLAEAAFWRAATTTPPTCTSPAARPARPRRGRGRPAGAHPHPAVARPGGRRSPRPRGLRRSARARGRRATYELAEGPAHGPAADRHRRRGPDVGVVRRGQRVRRTAGRGPTRSGTPPRWPRELGQLVRHGPKRATAGLFLEDDEDPPTVVGDHCGWTGGDGLPARGGQDERPRCGSARSPRSTTPSRGTRVRATARGATGWRRTRGSSRAQCARLGIPFSSDVPVVFERFDVVGLRPDLRLVEPVETTRRARPTHETEHEQGFDNGLAAAELSVAAGSLAAMTDTVDLIGLATCRSFWAGPPVGRRIVRCRCWRR